MSSTTALRAATADMAAVWEEAREGLLSAVELRHGLNRTAEVWMREAEHIYSPTVLRILREHGLDQELKPLDLMSEEARWANLPN